jgi:phosphatidylserine/phosphatidylglycerophosphate/cardiolipin synthase-like enzyme
MVGISLLLSAQAGCAALDRLADELNTTNATPTPLVLATNTPLPRYWAVYFTAPGTEGNPIQRNLIRFIEAADTTIDIAAFEFDLPAVAEALIAAEARGVQVRWVTDNVHGIQADAAGLGLFPRMQAGGVAVHDDDRSGLMHNKFIVIDGRLVWTGSTNLTENGTTRNNNNVIVFLSEALAAVYTREFEEMWAGQFGITSPSTVEQQRVGMYDSSVQVYFGPEDSVVSSLTYLLDKAQHSIRFMAFSFTHEAMGYVMRTNANLGVDVRGIFETRGAFTQYSELASFACAGIPVRTDSNGRSFHHKVIIVDDFIVATGSFNFSNNADTNNDENMIVIANREIAAVYIEEFERRWAEANEVVAGEDVTCPEGNAN